MARLTLVRECLLVSATWRAASGSAEAESGSWKTDHRPVVPVHRYADARTFAGDAFNLAKGLKRE